MLVAALVFAVLAALIHVQFFVLESVTFRRPAVWRRFGLTSQADADTVRLMAYNQGFYNLFLALGVLVGVVLSVLDHRTAAVALVGFATACMLGAAVVLVTSSRALARAAAIQGVSPLFALILLALS